MPYIIKKVGTGYKVAKASDPSKTFSKKPLTRLRAKQQLTALMLSDMLPRKRKK